jgi:hypothetical protein
MPGSTKVNGSWKTASGLSVKVGGTWRTATSAFINVGGVWKQWFASVITDNFSRASTASGLGTSETGQPWTSLIGDWRVSGSNNAISDNASALASVNFGSPDVIVSANVSVGTGPAFWISDAGSFWASYVHSTSTSTPYQYNYECNCQQLYSPPQQGCSGQCAKLNPAVPGSTYTYNLGNPPNCGCYGSDPGGTPIFNQGSTTWSYSGSATRRDPVTTCVCNSAIYSLLSGTRCYSTANFYSYIDATCTTSYITGCAGYYCSSGVQGPNPSTGGGTCYSCYTSSTSGGYYTCSDCTGTYAPTPAYYSYYYPAYPGCNCNSGDSGGGGAYSSGGYYYNSCQTCTGTAYNITNFYTLRLIRSIGGAVSQATGEISLSSSAGAIKVTTAGDAITVVAYSGNVDASSTLGTINHTAISPNKGVSVGLVKQPSTANQGSTADTFSAKIQGA